MCTCVCRGRGEIKPVWANGGKEWDRSHKNTHLNDCSISGGRGDLQ